MNISCNVMDDLLPLYAENMVSEDTTNLVRDHLAACSVCREKMKAYPAKEQQMHQSLDKLEKLERRIRSRRINAALFAFLLTATLLLSVGAWLISPVYLTLEEADVKVFQGDSVDFVYDVAKDGKLTYIGKIPESDENIMTLHFGGNVQHVSESRSVDSENGVVSLTITASCRRIDQLLSRNQPNGFTYSREIDFSRLYYASYDGREDTLLWGSEPTYGVQTLPRLALGYYVIIAIIFGAALLIGWLVRRKGREGKFLLACGSWFMGFAFSAILVSGGKWPETDATYLPWMTAFSCVLACFVAASVMCGRKLRKQHKEDL